MDRINQFVGMGGVRIEDNVLITRDGRHCFNITEACGVPKSVEKIEEMRADAHAMS